MENPDARQTEEWIESDSLKQVFLGMFSSLKPRDRDIMNYYFTLDPDTYMDIEALGVKYDLTRERIRQIKESIIKKRQTRKIKNIKKEITGEASKVRIVANLADTATPPHLREPVQKKEIITQHITSPIVSTHYISEVKQKLQETLQSYTEIRKEDIETMEEAPQMPVGLLKKEHRRAIQ